MAQGDPGDVDGAGAGREAPAPPQPVRVPWSRLPANGRGRDFLVGDVHGCFDLLLREMERVRFDAAADRIISVGDLVNRGPHSHRALRFLSYDWVACVRGNHEDLILRLHAQPDLPPATVAFLSRHHGMGWWFNAPERLRDEIAEAFARLPIAIEVETGEGPLGVVHADVPMGLAWGDFLSRLEGGDARVVRAALWNRDRVRGAECGGVDGIDRVAIGHCDLPDGVTRFGNVFCLDTGAVYGGTGPGHLSFVEASSLDERVPGPPQAADPGPPPTGP
jgi:serine/threonine protein phosphatase 1